MITSRVVWFEVFDNRVDLQQGFSDEVPCPRALRRNLPHLTLPHLLLPLFASSLRSMSAPSSLPPPSSSHQSDVRKRTVLPNTLQNLRTTNSASSQSAQLDQLDSDAYLDKLEEELNRKVDGEVEGLVEGLKELIALARVSLHQLPVYLGNRSILGLRVESDLVVGGVAAIDFSFFFRFSLPFPSLANFDYKSPMRPLERTND